jgi:hypothetical protein
MFEPLRREVVGKTVGFVLGSALFLTATFVGGLGLLSGELSDTGSRFPIYVLGMAAVFVGTVIAFTRKGADSVMAIVGSVGLTLVSFLLLTLAGEGLVYAVRNPYQVFQAQLLLYFLAAGLIATGLAYWLVAFWRELFDEPPPPPVDEDPE